MINFDITTKNTVYNTLSPQAQWVQHRFGKRDYPTLEVSTETVLSTIKQIAGTINFISVFGDPCSHANFVDILRATEPGRSVVNSNLNFSNDTIIEELNSKNSYVVVPLYGIEDLCNVVALNSSWNLISNNLKNLTCGVCVEFYLFEHNAHQVDAITAFCKNANCEIKIKKGSALHPDGFSPIVNEFGEWLYDVHPYEIGLELKWKELYKTVDGYNSLIQFVKTAKGRSILDNPDVFKVNNTYNYDNTVSISVTGEVFPSFELHQMFSNALCTDWDLSFSNISDLNRVTVREDFKYICASIEKVVDYLKHNNNIYSKDFKLILADLTNSDI
jgi:hypothetical protein